MQTFADKEKREWAVDINVTTVRDVKSALGVDLLELGNDDAAGEGKMLYRLMAEPILVVDIVYVICKDQADQAGVTDRQFGARMGGDAIDNATKALLVEIVNFFPDPRDRQRAIRVLGIIDGIIDQAHKAQDAKIDPEAIQKTTEELLTTTANE